MEVCVEEKNSAYLVELWIWFVCEVQMGEKEQRSWAARNSALLKQIVTKSQLYRFGVQQWIGKYCVTVPPAISRGNNVEKVEAKAVPCRGGEVRRCPTFFAQLVQAVRERLRLSRPK